MIDLVSHSPGTMEGSHSPAFVATPRSTALTAMVTCDPGAITVNEATKAELLTYAKGALELGERSLREAAEALGCAQDKHGATQREMAKAVGMSIGWVKRLLKWRPSPGGTGDIPFWPTESGLPVTSGVNQAITATVTTLGHPQPAAHCAAAASSAALISPGRETKGHGEET